MWSDNEDDVFLGNKPRDVMGIDALADNVISAKFPDDDEEFFDENKCFNLNEDINPYMGLNLQARQA